MAKLIYSALTSLDGYVADETGNFDWVEPVEQVHAFINSIQRQIGTYLFGRKDVRDDGRLGDARCVAPSDTRSISCQQISEKPSSLTPLPRAFGPISPAGAKRVDLLGHFGQAGSHQEAPHRGGHR
jgi:hypothetical protein